MLTILQIISTIAGQLFNNCDNTFYYQGLEFKVPFS